MITRELDLIKGYTCLDLAIAGAQLKFISHPSVLTIFNHFWRGPWKYEFTFLDFILTSLCPFYLTKFEYRGDDELVEMAELFNEHIYLKKEWTLPFPKRISHKIEKFDETIDLTNG